jgi:hypothetical protein
MRISLKAVVTAVSLITATGAATVVRADDQEVKKTEDTSHNPITGTETNTKKEEVKATHADGSVSKTKKKKVTKHKTDGSTSQKTETEKSTEQK